MDLLKLNNVEIKGDISVVPVPAERGLPIQFERYVILLIGPTGAGKSNLIEAIAGRSQNLAISSNQLEGYTQEVTAYQLVNVQIWGKPVYLIDTPGFADTHMSELEILGKIRDYMNIHGKMQFVDRVLFLTPITCTRLGGSNQRTIKMLQAFLSNQRSVRAPDELSASLTFVTTMWDDTLHNAHLRRRAETNFVQLKNTALKGFIGGGATIVRFWNTTRSAWQILGEVIHHHRFVSEGAFSNRVKDNAPHLPHLYQDLHERINVALQRKKLTELDLNQADTQGNQELRYLLENQHAENQAVLTKFIIQYIRFGPPPSGLEDAAFALRKAIEEESDMHLKDVTYNHLFRLWNMTQWPYIFSRSYPSEDGTFRDEVRRTLEMYALQLDGAWPQS